MIQTLNQMMQQNLQQMWQLLTPEERRSWAGSTEGYIDQIAQLTNQRLAEAERLIREDPNAPQNIMRDAGDIMHDAALAFVAAANTQNAAATAISTAASRRHEVDVDITVYDSRLDWEVNSAGGGE